MFRKPKISILTRLYERGEGLQLLADALSRQTYRDYEWILVDDGLGLTYVTADLLSQTHPRGGVKLITNKTRLTRGAALSLAMGQGSGEYCLVLDSNTAPRRACLRHASHTLDDHSDRVALIFGFLQHDEPGATPAERFEPSIPKKPPLITELAASNCLKPYATLFNRQTAEDVGGFDPSLDVLEDWDLYLRLILKQDFAVVSEVLMDVYGAKPFDNADAYAATVEETDSVLRERYLNADILNKKPGLGYLTKRSKPS